MVSAGRDDGDRRRGRHAQHRPPAHPHPTRRPMPMAARADRRPAPTPSRRPWWHVRRTRAPPAGSSSWTRSTGSATTGKPTPRSASATATRPHCDTYLEYDRIRAAPLAEHLDTIASAWITAIRAGSGWRSPPPPTTTSQRSTRPSTQYRDYLGQLGADRIAGQGGSFRVGDVIVTRRNERHLHTTTGDIGPQPRLLDRQRTSPRR